MTGSAPSVSTTTQPTIDPAQQALLASLAGNIGNPQGVGGALNFGQVQPQLSGTQYAAPLSNLQQTSLNGLQGLISSFMGNYAGQPSVAGPLNQAWQSVTNATTANPVQQVDATQAFEKGVVEPLTQDFTNYTIPAITGHYGQGAGGAFSSDAEQARQQAGTNLARTLAQTGSQYSLQAAEANQAAEATNAQLQLAASQLLPQLLGAPLQLAGAQESLLSGGLSAGAVPQATQQAQISGEYGDYQSMITQIQQRLADALGLSTAGTQQTQSIVNPGSQGFLPGLISAFAGGAGRSLFQPGLGSAGLLSGLF